MKKLAIHQPNFLAWGGFWDKMEQADHFVILDDAQYTKSSYINRVKMGDDTWITMPVKNKQGQLINQVELVNPSKNCKKLYKTICQNYRNVAEEFSWLQTYNQNNMLTLNLMLIQTVRYIKRISTPLTLSSELKIDKTASDRILGICKSMDYEYYLTGRGGMKYINLMDFEDNGITTQFVDYKEKHDDITILKYINNERSK